MRVQNKVLKSLIEYHVIEEKGIVIAKTNVHMFLSRLCSTVSRSKNSVVFLTIPKKYQEVVLESKATVAPEDEWDERYGKKLAFNKLSKQLKPYVNEFKDELLKETMKYYELLDRVGRGKKHYEE